MDTDLLQARVEALEGKIDKLEVAIDRLEKLLAKFEGAGTLVKLLFFIVTPIVGAIAWAKDHVKL